MKEIENVVDITAGENFSIVLTKDGQVYGCGYNYYGQLGEGTSNTKNKFVKMEEVKNIIQVSAGKYHTMMLSGDTTVWTVGYNANGELGINSTTAGKKGDELGLKIPRQVINSGRNAVLSGIEQISAGGNHNVVQQDDVVFTWGLGENGQLSQGNTSSFAYPVPVKHTNTEWNGIFDRYPKKVGATEKGTFILAGNASQNYVVVSGENSNYQLSQNNNTDLTQVKSSAVEGSVINIPSSSSSNVNNSSVITSDGRVWVSGLGADGQIGNDEFLTAQTYTRMGIHGLVPEEKVVRLTVGETKELNIEAKDGFNVYENEKDSAGELTFTSTNTNIVTVDSNG